MIELDKKGFTKAKKVKPSKSSEKDNKGKKVTVSQPKFTIAYNSWRMMPATKEYKDRIAEAMFDWAMERYKNDLSNTGRLRLSFTAFCNDYGLDPDTISNWAKDGSCPNLTFAKKFLKNSQIQCLEERLPEATNAYSQQLKIISEKWKDLARFDAELKAKSDDSQTSTISVIEIPSYRKDEDVQRNDS